MTAASAGAGPREPRPYQRDGIRWLGDKRRAFLTDGYGLGKTAQAIWAADTPCLIFAPGHLLWHWRREILACRPGARVVVADATRVADRQAQLMDGYVVGADFYVCNIEMLRTLVNKPKVLGGHFTPNIWFPGLMPIGYDGRDESGHVRTVIVDESHRLRGRTSQQHAGAREVCKRVERVYLLTQTPVYNQPDDLFGQLSLLDPERFGSYYSFCDKYLRIHHTPWGPKVIALKKDKKLKEVFAEYALGRTREEVGAQLPELQETLIQIKADEAFYKLYMRTRATYRDKYERMLMTQQSVLVALRNLTQQAKVNAAVQLVVDSGAKDTLIYTYHRALAEAIGAMLEIPVITGDMPASKREAVARAHDMIVATFPSVAEGIDLSHMQNVIYVEHDWSPGMMGQSLARVYRPGNLFQHMNVYHIVVAKTADAVVYNAFKRRGMTMQEIVNAALAPWDGDDEELDAG